MEDYTPQGVGGRPQGEETPVGSTLLMEGSTPEDTPPWEEEEGVEEYEGLPQSGSTPEDTTPLPYAVEEYIEYVGPSWRVDPKTAAFIIPRHTLGWECIAWIIEHCQTEEADGPFILTGEQARFILHWYEVEPTGRWVYDEGCLMRLKGWGKDPLICLLSLFEALGNCRFDGFDDTGNVKGKPVRNPLVQIAATTQDQTQTTLRLFSVYLTKEAMKKYRIEVNTEALKSDGIIVIQAVTGNPKALEGKVGTAGFLNETQHWYDRIGYEMQKVLARNAVKVKGGTARLLAITNAFDPNLNSVAQQTRETYDAQIAKTGKSRILFDSVEALPDAPLTNRTRIAQLVEAVRGDSTWADIERIVNEFYDTRYPVDLNRRFWLNTIVSSEEDWIDVRDFDKCVLASTARNVSIRKGDPIVMFGDFSKTDDSTVLVGCRLSDGYIFKIAAWHKPPRYAGPDGTKWIVPRNERDRKRYDFGDGRPNPYAEIETVDEAVERAFRDYTVKAFWADPSHAKESITNRLYWDEAIEDWHVKYSSQLKLWAGPKSGAKSESINWDMADPQKIEDFAEYCERVFDLIMRHDLLVEADQDFRLHARNAKVYKTRGGSISIWKGKKTSDRKIDLAVGMIGAYMLRSKYMKAFGETKKTNSSLNRFL